MSLTPLHQDPEISLASALMFLGVGKFMEWFTGHAEFFAGISYVLTSVAALATLYYKVKNKGK